MYPTCSSWSATGDGASNVQLPKAAPTVSQVPAHATTWQLLHGDGKAGLGQHGTAAASTLTSDGDEIIVMPGTYTLPRNFGGGMQ